MLRTNLLTIAYDTGRIARSEPSYTRAVDALAQLEDTLIALALTLPERETLSGRQEGYLPARHPKALANTLTGLSESIHPAFRRTAQTEEFSE